MNKHAPFPNQTAETFELRQEVNAWLNEFNQKFERSLEFCEGISTPAIAHLAIKIQYVKDKIEDLPAAESLIQTALAANHPIANKFPESRIVGAQTTPKLHGLFMNICSELGLPLQRTASGEAVSDIAFWVTTNPAVFTGIAVAKNKTGPQRVVIGLPLINRLNDAEIKSLLAHELSHHKYQHLTIRNLFNIGIKCFRGALAGALVVASGVLGFLITGLFNSASQQITTRVIFIL